MAPQGEHLVQAVPASLTESITLKVPANTDLWRKPPAHNAFNGPIVYETIPLKDFRSARVTVQAKWVEKFDQGGFFFGLPAISSTIDNTKSRWLKSGIEFYEGKPFASCVATDAWSDWSLVPLSDTDAEQGKVTIEFERDHRNGVLSNTLWVYIINGESKQPIREVTWVFQGAEDENMLCQVGIYAARPAEEGTPELEVTFSNFNLVTA